ncbi:MAG: MASE1 domain-containing protein [Patulibacter minatonensis]
MAAVVPLSRALREHGVWRTVGFALAYAAAVWLGRMTRLDGTPIALAWPAAGVALLWLMMSGRTAVQRLIDLGLIFAITYAGNLLTGAPGPLSAGFGIANSLQAYGTALLAGGALELKTARGSRRALVRLGIASLVGAVLGAIAGPLTLAMIDGPAWPVEPAVWIFRNGVSTFALIAAYLAFRVTPPTGANANREAIESTALLVGAAAVSGAVFAGVTGVPVAFAILPASVLVGLRCGVRASALHNLLTWGVVVTATYYGRGPFAVYDVNQRVVLTQALVLVVAMITLVIALSREEERELERRLDDERAFVSALVGQLSENLFICDEHGRLQGFDTQRRALVPLITNVSAKQWPAALGAHLADGSRLMELEELPLYRALRGEYVESTEVLVRTGDTERMMMVTAEPIYDASGRSRGAVARTADVTELRRAEAEAERRAADLAVLAPRHPRAGARDGRRPCEDHDLQRRPRGCRRERHVALREAPPTASSSCARRAPATIRPRPPRSPCRSTAARRAPPSPSPPGNRSSSRTPGTIRRSTRR